MLPLPVWALLELLELPEPPVRRLLAWMMVALALHLLPGWRVTPVAVPVGMRVGMTAEVPARVTAGIPRGPPEVWPRFGLVPVPVPVCQVGARGCLPPEQSRSGRQTEQGRTGEMRALHQRAMARKVFQTQGFFQTCPRVPAVAHGPERAACRWAACGVGRVCGQAFS